MYKSLLVLLTVLFASPKGSDKVGEFKISGYAQGTTYQITYYAEHEYVKKGSIDSIVKVIDQSMSLYDPNSLINNFNKSTGGTLVDFHFMEVYQRAKAISKDTDGRFDVTVAPLVQLWGFGPNKIVSFPDSALIKHTLLRVGMAHLHSAGRFLKKDHPNVEVDFNGIAQGYTVDLIWKHLRSFKIKGCMVELGGEIRVHGTKPNKQLFKIGLEGPTNKDLSTQGFKHVIQLNRGAITTSGNYQKYRMNGNQRISHLINPKTGYPLKNEMISVTVFAKDAITADGYDNALMGMNVNEALAFVARKKKIAAYIIYVNQDGELADTISARFKKLITN